MTKKLVALLLALIMVLACLVSCGETEDEIEDIAEEGSEKTITLSVYLMSEKEVSDDQALAIQNAVNKITKSKFKTQLILHYFTEDEYYDALEDAYDQALDAFVEEDNALKEESGSETEEETFIDEYGVVQLKYPTIPDYQVDIFYISGYDRLVDYIDCEMVHELSTEVENSSKALKSYVHPSYLESVNSMCDGLYAIPTNAPIGEYTYLLLNKDILKEYNHVASDFNSLFCQNTKYLLDHVSKNNTDYVPLRSFTGNSLDIANLSYVGINEDGEFDDTSFSLIGGYTDGRDDGYPFGPASRLFEDTRANGFREQFKTLVSYKENGYYGTEKDANKPFAMGYIKGGLEVVEEYGDEYEVVVLETPKLSTSDVFENMFSVSTDSTDLARSMEILTYMYTNKDFNNLLVYGIEGENYEFVESDELDTNGIPYKLVKRYSTNKYFMSPEKLGNVILSYPTVGQSPKLCEMYKKQNMDATAGPTLGMSIVAAENEFTLLSYEHAYHLYDESQKVLEDLLKIEKVADVDPYFNALRKAIEEDAMLKTSFQTASIDGSEEEGIYTYSLPGLYDVWMKAQTSGGDTAE